MDSTAVICEFKKASRLHGVYGRVAKRLEVSPQHVREVALGNRRSERVMKSLRAELLRIERANGQERAA